MFIASDKIVSAIHFQVQYDTADEQVYQHRYSDQQTSFVPETKDFWHWTCMRFALVETNTLVLETNTLKTCIRISVTRTHSQLPATSKQNLGQLHLQKRALSLWGDAQRCYMYMHNGIFHGQIIIYGSILEVLVPQP